MKWVLGHIGLALLELSPQGPTRFATLVGSPACNSGYADQNWPYAKSAGASMETYNAPSWLAPYTIEAKSILNFCDLHDGLLADLKQAIEIAKVDFPNREEIDVQTVVDPDDGSSLIAVNVTVRDTVANFMTAYRACVSHWSSVFQAPGREFICLGHRIIKP